MSLSEERNQVRGGPERGKQLFFTNTDFVQVLSYSRDKEKLDALFFGLREKYGDSRITSEPLYLGLIELWELDYKHEYDLEEFMRQFGRKEDGEWKMSEDVGEWVYNDEQETLEQYLENELFYRIRTSRNFPKITIKEQDKIRSSKIAFLGLSTGQATALVLARMNFENFVLIDPDIINPSNGNRMDGRIGENKAIATAKMLVKINPFIKVKVYTDRATADNLKDRLDGVGIIVEMVDDFSLKVTSQNLGKENNIPVVTSAGVHFSPVGSFYLPGDSKFHGRISKEEITLLEKKKIDLPKTIELVKKIIGEQNITERTHDGFDMMARGEISYLSQLAIGSAGSSVLNAFVIFALVNGYTIDENEAKIDLPNLFKASPKK